MTDRDHIAAVVERLGELFGLSFTDSQHNTLLRNLGKAAGEHKRPTDLVSLRQWLDNEQITRDEIDSLSRHLTIGETYFFREKVALDLFTQVIIPRLAANSREGGGYINIWSAGCSTGEEPYSLAILLQELLPERPHLHVSIVATDLNRDALEKARQALYTQWSFRETSPELKQKYFTPVDGRFQLNAEITRMVQFKQLNLAEEEIGIFSEERQFDVIFCRNVLMYFLPEKIRAIARGFHRCLRNDGWLITSQVELNDDYFSPFKRILWNKGIFYQKAVITVPMPGDVSMQTVGLRNQELTVDDGPKKQKMAEPRVARRSGESRKKPVSLNITSPDDRIDELQRLFHEGGYEECARRCVSVIQRDGFNEAIAGLLVKALSNSGKLREAADWAARLVEVSRDQAASHYLQATVLLELNDDEAAAAALQKVLYLAPAHLAARLNLGQLLLRSGKRAPAIRHFKNLLNDLEQTNDEEVLDEMGGITAGRLRQMTEMLLNR